jgi:hypothetical protein
MSDPKEYIVTVVVDGENINATRIVHNGTTLMPRENDENRVEYQYENKDDFEITEEQLKDNNKIITNNSQGKNNVSPNILKNETTDLTTDERQLNKNAVTTTTPKGFAIPSARSINGKTQRETDSRLSVPSFTAKKNNTSYTGSKWRGGKSRRPSTRKNKKNTKTMRRKRRNL